MSAAVTTDDIYKRYLDKAIREILELEHEVADAAGGGPVAVVLSGGNIDASTLIAVMRHGVTLAGRHLVVRTHVPDRPGELLKLLQLVAEERVNVLSVEHRREGVDIPVGATGIDLTLLARDEEHSEAIVEEIRGWGYEVERLR